MAYYLRSSTAGVLNGVQTFYDPTAQVANFLAHLYKEGYKYSSVNAYRSAISSVHEKVDGYIVGQL